MFAVITDLTPKKNLTEAYGFSQQITNVAWIIGPLAGGYMFSHLGFTYLIGVTIITGALCLILTAAFLRDSFKADKEVTNFSAILLFKKDIALTTYTVLAMLVFIVYVQIVDIYPVFIVERLGFNTTQYGILLMFNAILLVIFQYPVTHWVNRRLGDKNALIYGAVLFTIGYLSLSWITSYSLSYIFVIVVTAAELLFIPSMSSIVGKLAEPEQRGRYMGLLGTGTGLGIAIGPLLGGALYDFSHGTSLLLWVPLALLTIIAVFGFLRLFSVYKGRLQ
jgi:MFS family permease